MSRELRTELPVGWEKRLALMVVGSERRCMSLTVAAKRLGVEVDVLFWALPHCPHFQVVQKTGGWSIRPNWGLRVPAELR
jgi:hypothetical protein